LSAISSTAGTKKMAVREKPGFLGCLLLVAEVLRWKRPRCAITRTSGSPMFAKVRQKSTACLAQGLLLVNLGNWAVLGFLDLVLKGRAPAMNAACERLMHLRVEHVMARDVVTVHEDCSLAEAAKLMLDCEVSGMPVVDDYGRCVGVLSATDFVACKTEELPGHAPEVRMAATVDCAGHPHAVAIDTNTVRAHMSQRVETVREHSSIVDAGQLMCRSHIHRLIVVNRQNHPIGVVSSLDLVSALVHAVEEAQLLG